MGHDADDFEDWWRDGYERGFCGPPVCATHDGVPTTSTEDQLLFEEGEDVCLHIVRLYTDLAQAKAVVANHAPSAWRANR